MKNETKNTNTDAMQYDTVLCGVKFKKIELTGEKLRAGRCMSCEATYGIHKNCMAYGELDRNGCGCLINENYIKVNAT